MFGINGGEALVLLVVAVVVVGPERLPQYAARLGVLVRQLRRFALEAKARVDEELGDQVGDVDWQSLDPRQYDPRRIVRDALLDDLVAGPTPGARASEEPARPPVTPADEPAVPRTSAAAGAEPADAAG